MWKNVVVTKSIQWYSAYSWYKICMPNYYFCENDYMKRRTEALNTWGSWMLTYLICPSAKNFLWILEKRTCFTFRLSRFSYKGGLTGKSSSKRFLLVRFTYHLLLRVRSLHGNVRPRPWCPCNYLTEEVYTLFIIWPFHYGPELAIN